MQDCRKCVEEFIVIFFPTIFLFYFILVLMKYALINNELGNVDVCLATLSEMHKHFRFNPSAYIMHARLMVKKKNDKDKGLPSCVYE
jgi:hypothetical protein